MYRIYRQNGKPSLKLLPETRKSEQNVSQFQITSLNPDFPCDIGTIIIHEEETIIVPWYQFLSILSVLS